MPCNNITSHIRCSLTESEIESLRRVKMYACSFLSLWLECCCHTSSGIVKNWWNGLCHVQSIFWQANYLLLFLAFEYQVFVNWLCHVILNAVTYSCFESNIVKLYTTSRRCILDKRAANAKFLRFLSCISIALLLSFFCHHWSKSTVSLNMTGKCTLWRYRPNFCVFDPLTLWTRNTAMWVSNHVFPFFVLTHRHT